MNSYLTNPAIELLVDEIDTRGISQANLARALSVSKSLISDLMHHRKRISIEMALRLEKYFGIKASLWLGIQQQYELTKARKDLSERINQQVISA